MSFHHSSHSSHSGISRYIESLFYGHHDPDSFLGHINISSLIVPSIILAVVFILFEKKRGSTNRTIFQRYCRLWFGLMAFYICSSYLSMHIFGYQNSVEYIGLSIISAVFFYLLARWILKWWPIVSSLSPGRLMVQAIIAFLLPIYLMDAISIIYDVENLISGFGGHVEQAIYGIVFVFIFYLQNKLVIRYRDKYSFISDNEFLRKSRWITSFCVVGYLSLAPVVWVLLHETIANFIWFEPYENLTLVGLQNVMGY